MGESFADDEVAIKVTDLHKQFGGAHALRGVTLEVRRGTVHSLVGENGAGKSTLLGILAGRIAPGQGGVEAFGVAARTGDPRLARLNGIAAIYQELTIVPALSALSNVFLGHPLTRAGIPSFRRMRIVFDRLASDLGVDIDPKRPAGELSVADQQLVEIMRALQARARVILFDEPTASLSAPERRLLHELIVRLRCRGVTMIFVSHNLDEVLSLSDQITVFRDGSLVETRQSSDWTKSELVSSMLGTPVASKVAPHQVTGSSSLARRTQREPSSESVLFRVHVSIPKVLHDVEFDINRNEILGIAGLVGSGRSALLRSLAGAESAATGWLASSGMTCRIPRTVRAGRSLGLALLPEDRKLQGLVTMLSVERNIVLSDLRRVSRCGWIRRKHMTRTAAEATSSLDFDSRRLRSPVRDLSGGNQQKTLLARWTFSKPAVLLADEPTRGIDIGAKRHIAQALQDYSRTGTSIVMVSSEIEELIDNCDRILVLARGRLAGEFHPRRDAVSENQVLAAAFAGKVETS